LSAVFVDSDNVADSANVDSCAANASAKSDSFVTNIVVAFVDANSFDASSSDSNKVAGSDSFAGTASAVAAFVS
jgi:hypothetical protein